MREEEKYRQFGTAEEPAPTPPGVAPAAAQNPISQGSMAIMQSMEGSAVPMPDGTVNGFQVLERKINEKVLSEAGQTLMKYKEGKANLERRVIDNQEWYKLRQWEVLRRKNRGTSREQVEPTSGWLFNAIQNKHAASMDNFPRANIQPRESGDVEQAKILSEIIPVILDQAEFEETYSNIVDDKLISGTGIYGVFWDSKKHNGLGDISIECIDVLNLFWEPGIQDIQRSQNVFYVSLKDNEILEEEFPQFKNRLGGKTMTVAEYVYDDTVDTTKKSIVVDWYYKKNTGGKNVLHFCKFIMGQTEALYASEDDPQYADRGWYDDGDYPFVFDVCYKSKGTPCGTGFVDVGKSPQEYIDRAEQAIQQNLLFNAKPRHFIRSDGSVNEEEYADSTKDFVHVDGALGTDSVMPITVNPLSQVYVSISQNKILELKETTGNRDVTTGGTTSGVTAASGVAAMQEAGAKLDRDLNKGSYRAFRKVINLAIERIRQFYDMPRMFRIIGENGAQEFVQFSNAGIIPQAQGNMFGIDMGFRTPYFDIEVTAEKASPYTRMGQNELALQFYSAGFFAPQNAPAALACLNMMDFDHKDEVLQMVAQNGTLQSMLMQAQQQALQLAQMVDAMKGSNLTGALQAEYQTGMPAPGNPMPGKAAAENTEALGGNVDKEARYTADARKKTAEASAPQ